MKALINESNPITAQGLKQLLLKHFDYEDIILVKSVSEILAFTKKEAFSLLIFDTSVPKVELKQLINSIKQDNIDINLIVYGDARSDKFELQYISMGVNGYISKSSSEKEIVNAITLIKNGQVYLSQNALRNQSLDAGLNGKDPLGKLSKRELQVFEYLIQGKKVNDICAKLGIHQSTASTLKKRVMHKTNVNSLAGLIKLATKFEYI